MKKICMVLVCVLLVFIPNCKNPPPTTPDIDSVVTAQIDYFTATPVEIEYGESSTLSWSTKNATTVTIDNGIGAVSAEGEKVVSPEETMTYVLTAKNNAGETTKSCNVEVGEPPPILPVIEFFSSSYTTIEPGQQVVLSWLVTNATQVSITYEGSVLNDPLSLPNAGLEGEYIVYPRETATYTLIAQNDYTIENNFPVTATATVTVRAYPSFELTDEYRIYESGVCVLSGSVKNTGNVPAYNVWIKFKTFSYYDNSVQVGTAQTVLNDGEIIEVGRTVSFTAVHAPLINDWSIIHRITHEITWEVY